MARLCSSVLGKASTAGRNAPTQLASLAATFLVLLLVIEAGVAAKLSSSSDQPECSASIPGYTPPAHCHTESLRLLFSLLLCAPGVLLRWRLGKCLNSNKLLPFMPLGTLVANMLGSIIVEVPGIVSRARYAKRPLESSRTLPGSLPDPLRCGVFTGTRARRCTP